MILKFERYSDDTFGEVDHFKDTQDNGGSGAPIRYQVRSPNGEVLTVIGQYDVQETGCWSIAVRQVDEDHPVPAWRMHIERSDCPYSPRLVMEVPEGSGIRCLERAMPDTETTR